MKKYLPFLILFLLLLQIASKIQFQQNDDWFYYEQIQSAMSGDFKLHPEIAPTLYVQTLLGALFAFVFGVKNLPVLTLLVSIANLCLIYEILLKRLSVPNTLALLSALMIFVAPLYNYSVWGFMTEQYFLTFFLLGIYYFPTKTTKANLFVLLSFFVRQIGLVFYLGTAAHFFIKKKYKEGVHQVLWFVGVYSFYLLIFPKTEEMLNKSLTLSNVLQGKYVFTLLYGSLFYLVAFTLPLVIYFLVKDLLINKTNLRYLLAFVGVAIALNFMVANNFNPDSISWGEFPFFENTFERTGYYPRSIHGTKYQFRGIYDLYYYWQITTNVVLMGFLSFAVVNIGKFLNEYSSILFIYLAVSTLIPTFFDRYLVIAIPLFVFLLYRAFENNKSVALKLSTAGYVCLIGLLSLMFTLDFINVENIAWKEASTLSSSPEESNNILASSAWNEKFARKDSVEFLISYDSPQINPELSETFVLEKKIKVNKTPTLYINDYLYIYSQRENRTKN